MKLLILDKKFMHYFLLHFGVYHHCTLNRLWGRVHLRFQNRPLELSIEADATTSNFWNCQAFTRLHTWHNFRNLLLIFSLLLNADARFFAECSLSCLTFCWQVVVDSEIPFMVTVFLMDCNWVTKDWDRNEILWFII